MVRYNRFRFCYNQYLNDALNIRSRLICDRGWRLDEIGFGRHSKIGSAKLCRDGWGWCRILIWLVEIFQRRVASWMTPLLLLDDRQRGFASRGRSSTRSAILVRYCVIFVVIFTKYHFYVYVCSYILRSFLCIELSGSIMGWCGWACSIFWGRREHTFSVGNGITVAWFFGLIG